MYTSLYLWTVNAVSFIFLQMKGHTVHTAVDPFLTASWAYSTWKRCPSGENTVIALSYDPPDMVTSKLLWNLAQNYKKQNFFLQNFMCYQHDFARCLVATLLRWTSNREALRASGLAPTANFGLCCKLYKILCYFIRFWRFLDCVRISSCLPNAGTEFIVAVRWYVLLISWWWKHPDLRILGIYHYSLQLRFKILKWM